MRPKIFLDLDATLIRSYNEHELDRWPQLLPRCLPVRPGLYTIPRPGLLPFLAALRVKTDLYLFTAANLDYASGVLGACGVRDYFLDLHCSGVEDPGKLAERYGLADKVWMLVEDTPEHHHLTRYKLLCLGVELRDDLRDAERSRPHFVQVSSFQPHDQFHEPNMDVILKRVLAKCVGR